MIIKITNNMKHLFTFNERLKGWLERFATFATSATFASANFVGKESCESTVRYGLNYGLKSRITTTYLRLASALTLICLLGVGNVWGANTTISAGDVVSGSNYKAHSTSNWIITFGGNNSSVGTNSGNRNNCKLSSYSNYAVSPVTTSDVASAFVSLNSLSNINKVSYTFSGGSNQSSTNVYLIYSSNGTTFSQLSLTKGTQGHTISSGTELEFAKSTGYFGLLFKATNSSGNWRIDGVQITFYEDDTPSCTNPTTLLSISSSNTATVGTNKTLTTSGGNNGTVTWSVANGTGSATVSGNILTPTSAGTVTVTATQDDNGGKCGKVVNQTITISKVAATITLSDANGTSSVSGTHYGGDFYTLPTTAATCTGKTLVGWSTVEILEEGAKPSSNYYDKGTSVTLAAGSNKYYAVYATKLTDGSSSPAQLSFTYGSHEGWTLHSAYDKNSYYLLQNNSYIESPTINDLSSITSIVIGVGSFASKGAGSVSDGSTTYASFSIPASNSNNSVTLQPQTNPLSGSGKIRITNTDGSSYTTDNNKQKGTRFYSMTINYTTQTPPTYKSDYATTCCTPLAQINGSVVWTNPTTAVVTWNKLDDQVTNWNISWSPNTDGSSIISAIADKGSTQKTATISGLACGTEYTFTLTPTVKSGVCPVNTNPTIVSTSSKYQITLANNGSVTGGTFFADEDACNGDNVDLLAEAATGYAFNGWTITKASSGNISPEANEAETTFEMPAEAVTVSAAFSLVNYSITYENMEGATNNANNPATYTVNSDAITLGAPTKDGFDFGGWFTNGDLAPEHAVGSPAIAKGSHENKTFYAKWTQAGTHTVTIADYSNGSVSVTYTGMESALTSGSRVIAENTVLTITATPNTGYDVLITVGGEDFTSGSTHTLVADIAIEALFEPKSYTITYKDKDDEDYSGSNFASLPKTHTYNTATALVDGVKAGNSFGGWFTDADCTESAGSSIAANSITADITLYAKWEELTMYTVTWKVNGATYTAGTPSTSVEDGSKVTTLPTAPTVCDDDLTFMGWTDAAIEGTQVSAPAVLFTTNGAAPAVTGNVTYHAVFAQADELTASFNAADISNLTENNTNNWTHTASGITFYITAGQRYTKNPPHTFTITKGSYCGLTSPDGVTIKKVILTCTSADYLAASVSPGTLATSGTTQTITSVNDEYLYIYASTSDQIRITNIDVKYTPALPTYSNYRTSYAASVPTPTLDVASGKYTSDQLVTISNYDGNYMYFYTTNGSTPAADANLDAISPAVAYDSNDGIAITSDCTLKVIAYDLCHNASEVTTATYTIAESLTLAEFVEQKPTTNEKVDLTGAIVMAREDNRLYVQKDAAAMCLYYSAGAPSFAVGKQIANGLIQGSYDAEYLEMDVSNAGSPTASADGVLPTPLVITDDNAETLMVEANMYRYAQINSVTLDEDTYSYLNAYSTTSDNSYYYEDQFSVLGTLPLTTTECTVKGIINPYTSSEVHYFDQLSPILTNDISTNATAVLPTISDLGGTDAAHAVEVAEGKEITLTEDADFDAIYQINDGAETAINSSAVVTITNTAAATKVYVKASRDYYADNAVTYYYIANAALTEHTITCATGLTGGSISADKSSAVNGATVTLTPTPNDHYSLTSWTVTYNDGEEKTINVVNNQFTMPGYNVNVTATFAEDAYATVSFAKGAEAATGDVPANQKVYVGNDVTLPANPFTYAGHNFAGWKFNETTKQAGETYAITAAGTITFTAQWTANPICTVTLHANGADDIVTEVVQGATYNIPNAGTIVGYTFLGWAAAAQNSEVTEAIDVVSSFTPEVQAVASTKEFYAVYTRQEGTTQYEKVTSAPADWSGQYLIVNEEDGKAWKGSTNDDNGAIDVTITNQTIAASATVDAERFTIASMTGGYSIKGTSGKYIAHKMKSKTEVDNGTTYNADPQLNTISIDGDANVTISSSTAVLRQNNSSANLFRYYKSGSYSNQHTIQLYKYVEALTYYTTNPTVKYNVSYELGDGDWRENEGCDDSAVDAGTVYNVVCEDQPVLENKVFDKWQVSGADIVLPYTINASTTFTAVYRDAVQYAVNYDANGGVGNAPAATNVLEAADYTILDNSWFFRSGHTFQGWNTSADGSGSAYAAEAVMAMPSANVTLYAQWQELPANNKEVVIVAKAGENYYAMGQTLNNSDQFNTIAVAGVRDNKVILQDGFSDENKTAITWHMITNDNGATASFYSPANNKYLAGGSNLSLSNDPVVWTWSSENQCYVIGGRTFMYRNTYNFKSYSTQNIGATGYAEAMYVTTAFAKAITEDDATEADLSLGDNIVVQDGATLTIGNERFINDVVVENGGNLTLNANANLSVHDLVIHSTLGKGTGTTAQGNAPGNCGQVANGGNITVNGDVYLELELTQDAAASAGWYAFSVPFQVDAMNGVYYGNTKLTNEVGYAIMSYHGDLRAQGLYGWKKYRGIMQPGVFYVITVGNTDYKTLRFKKVAGEALVASTSVPVSPFPTQTDNNSDGGWNGIGNPNLAISNLSTSVPTMQFYDHKNNSFIGRDHSVNLVVGSAFFIQYNATTSVSIPVGINAGNGYLAPRREQKAVEETIYEVQLTNVATGELEDNVFLTAREDAMNSYEIGHDVAKMSMGAAKCAQMYVPAYGTNLCAADFPLIDNKAIYPLMLNTPKADSYSISVKESDEADIYLTYNGSIIWNLSMGAYEIELAQGTTEGYGLKLVRKAPGSATGVDEVQRDKVQCTKVVIDDHVYILRGGQIYDVTGKAVK